MSKQKDNNLHEEEWIIVPNNYNEIEFLNGETVCNCYDILDSLSEAFDVLTREEQFAAHCQKDSYFKYIYKAAWESLSDEVKHRDYDMYFDENKNEYCYFDLGLRKKTVQS